MKSRDPTIAGTSLRRWAPRDTANLPTQQEALNPTEVLKLESVARSNHDEFHTSRNSKDPLHDPPSPLPIPEVTVQVDSDYLSICEYFSEGGVNTQERWKYLGRVLERREGWRFAIFNSNRGLDAAWCFGEPGRGAVLIVHGEIEGFRVFDYFADEAHVIATEDAFRRWLQARETAVDARYLAGIQKQRVILRDLRDENDGFARAEL